MNCWQGLIISSFITPGIFCALEFLTMEHLTSLEVEHTCFDSAALTSLLDHISKTAMLLSQMAMILPLFQHLVSPATEGTHYEISDDVGG
jgi:hypothetical protein